MNCDRCGGLLHEGKCPHCEAHRGVEPPIDATGTIKLDPVTQDATDSESSVTLNAGEAALQVLRGPSAGEVWVLDGNVIDIGRAQDSQLFLDDVTVSRRHALLKRIEGEWFVEDQSSLNGTYVDQVQIEAMTPLHTGCELQIGKFKFRFVDGPAK